VEVSSALRVAVCQMTSVDDAALNLQQMSELLESVATQGGAQIAFFPENCLYMRLKEGEAIPGLSLQDEVFRQAEKMAAKFDIDLHFGSVPLRLSGDKLFNSSVFIPAGKPAVATYQKIHLFDIALEGQAPICESDVFGHGENAKVIESHGWKLGQTICYDLRFSELFHLYVKQHVDVILVPSAFLITTGQAHWEILLRARAIESQSYVIAAAQAGVHQGASGGRRETYGRSLVIDPWGKVLWEGGGKSPEARVIDLTRQNIDQVRGQIPMKSHRRI
jgi:deaminated glutathione amidase